MPAPGQTLMLRDLIAEACRHLVGLVVWGAGIACALVIEVLALNAHYLSTSSALELLGEQKPLGLDPLLGVYLGSLLENASQNHFRALIIVAVIAVGSLIVAHLVSSILTLFEHRAACQRAIAALGPALPGTADELVQARTAANYRILFLTIWLALIGALVGTAAYWDLTLNWYQQIASINGLDQPVEAAATIQVPDREMAAYGHLVAWQLARLGAYGFLAIMILGAVFLEYSTHRVSDRWGRLCNMLAELFTFNRSDELDTPEYETGDREPNRPQAAPPADGAIRGQTPSPAGAPLFDAPFAPATPTTTATPPAPQSDPSPADRILEVIGGAASEQITIEAALRDPARYWVDRDNERVWNRAYHEALTQPGDLS